MLNQCGHHCTPHYQKGHFDSITSKYEETKMKAGEFVQEKTAILTLMSLSTVLSLLSAATSALTLNAWRKMRNSLLILTQSIGLQPRTLQGMSMRWESTTKRQPRTIQTFSF